MEDPIGRGLKTNDQGRSGVKSHPATKKPINTINHGKSKSNQQERCIVPHLG